jgi:arylsulfatase A-like enzyme
MRRRYRADVGRAIAMATGGAAAFAPIEYALTLWAYPGSVDGKLRLAALTATLSLFLWLVLVVVLIAAVLVRPGLFALSALDQGVRRGVPRLWAMLATSGLVGGFVQVGAAWAIVHYKEPQLTAMVVAVIALVGVAVAPWLYRVLAASATAGARALEPVLGAYNPLGRWRPAGIALVSLLAVMLEVTYLSLPQARSEMHVRLVISAVVVAIGCGIGAMPRRPLVRKRSHALAVAGTAFVLVVATLWKLGADLETKYAAKEASPALDALIGLVRVMNDLDGDGFGSVLGENDCAPFDSSIYPGAQDTPDDGIDQNCDGHDFSMRPVVVPSGPARPVPPQFKKPWNILLITVDTLRYDSTTFGGYKEGPKHRDTTPRLAELVSRSTSFTFCNAPSAGTMASIPAIITSKFFHSGIALDEHVPPGAPPRLKPENTTLPEIMKRGGYYTGVIASHEYWNDWGMDQGVDDYDNSIGKTPDPYRVAADKVTDHALAWISRQQGTKWFLWAHYIDPHGRYVAHHDVVDWDGTEPDRYDAEVRWTDQEIGRLLDELVRLPSNENTIIIVTSDHGDSMGEHTVPVGTHGTALYRELQHVPLIYYVPDNKPHLIGGAVSNLDIVPTVAELAGIDVHDLSFEGQSDVPAIFYGNEDHDRIVFAETNAPTPQRAAISESWKLIYYLNSGLYELYNLKADPWEHDNVAPKHPPAFDTMRAALNGWLERVVFSRDPKFNQANNKIKDVLLAAPVAPAVAADQSLDHGKLGITGISLDGAAPKVDVQVFFEVKERTQIAYKLQVAIWPVDLATWKATDPMPTNVVRSGLRVTADGYFPSDRWHVGDHVRDRFPVTLPESWTQSGIAVALTAVDGSNHSESIVLGVVPNPGFKPGSPAPPRP